MTNENNAQTQDKRYKVLLVEDIFFKDKPDTPEIIGGLEKEIAGKTRHPINLEITPRVDRALENISTKDYNLVVTDVGLTYPCDNRSNWKERLPEIYKNMTNNLTKNKPKLETELGLNLDEFKDLNNYDKIAEIRGEDLAETAMSIYDSCYYNEDNTSGAIVNDEFGIEIYNKSKKSPTVIFTNRNHCNESLARLCAHGIINTNEAISLNKRLWRRENLIKHNSIYVADKGDLGNFAYVIDDAIDNFVEKK
ncbi:MAG: hypothetical protein ACP5NZ_05040 [Nanobdellota archaeon]